MHRAGWQSHRAGTVSSTFGPHTPLMSSLAAFLQSNGALVVAILALVVSLAAHRTARAAHALNLKARRDQDRVRLFEKKRETLNELDTQYTRMATLSMVIAQKILLFRDNRHLHESMPEEFARLKKNLASIEQLRSRYTEQRAAAEALGDGMDIAAQEEILAEVRRLTIHIEKDIAHEQCGLSDLVVRLPPPRGA